MSAGTVALCFIIMAGFLIAITMIFSDRIVDLDRRVTRLEHHVHALERP